MNLRYILDTPIDLAGFKSGGRTMHAGGPGSGRHPGADKLLQSHGWKYKGNDKGEDARGNAVQRSVYKHPEHGKLAVEPSGSWNHGMGGAGTFRTLGNHLNSLDKSY
jgi:hypothetical protein